MADDYESQFKRFRDNDTRRDEYQNRLLLELRTLQAKHHETLADLGNEQTSRRYWQQEAKDQEMAMTEQKQLLNSNNFVVVLIDGDGALFLDELYKLAGDGGRKTAMLLHSAIQSQLRSRYPESAVSDWTVKVIVACNLEGLAKTLACSRIISDRAELTKFSQAFNLAHPLFDFIDVGMGKEHADHKLREHLRFCLANVQCKHVYFAGCHDGGYVPVLEEYSIESRQSSRITLVETAGYPAQFTRLGLDKVTMTEVFSSTIPKESLSADIRHEAQLTHSAAALSNVAASAGQQTVVTRPSHVTPPSNVVATSPFQHQPKSYADISRAPSNLKSVNNVTATVANEALKHMSFNQHNERIDHPLVPYFSAAEMMFQKRLKLNGMKFCNQFNLTGHCPLVHCQYKHDSNLPPGVLLVLKHKARMFLCKTGRQCTDMNCISGHSCLRGASCSVKPCFLRDTHGMDLVVTHHMFTDGCVQKV